MFYRSTKNGSDSIVRWSKNDDPQNAPSRQVPGENGGFLELEIHAGGFECSRMDVLLIEKRNNA